MIKNKKKNPNSSVASEHVVDDKPFIIIDGSNVAYGGGKYSQPQLWVIRKVRSDLSQHGYQHVTFIDATLRHRIDDSNGLEDLIRTDQVQQTPARTEADAFIKQLANMMRKEGKKIKILTNDIKMLEAGDESLERIAFSVITVLDRQEIFFEPPLEGTVLDSSYQDDPGEEEVWEDEDTDKMANLSSPINPDLLTSFIQYLSGRRYLLEGTVVPFSSLANHLHKKHGGNFCEKFGYKKPKDFVLALQDEHYITIEKDRDPLFIRIERKTIREGT